MRFLTSSVLARYSIGMASKMTYNALTVRYKCKFGRQKPQKMRQQKGNSGEILWFRYALAPATKWHGAPGAHPASSNFTILRRTIRLHNFRLEFHSFATESHNFPIQLHNLTIRRDDFYNTASRDADVFFH